MTENVMSFFFTQRCQSSNKYLYNIYTNDRVKQIVNYNKLFSKDIVGGLIVRPNW